MAASADPNQIARYEYCIRPQMQVIDELRAEVDQLKKIIAEGGALGVLQTTYADPAISVTNRIKAASAAIGFERPKVSVNVRVGPGILGARLEQARAPETIEHQPAPPEAA
jgi:hypothetical protein